MLPEPNKSVKIFDILKASYFNLINNFKQALIASYMLAAFFFLASFILPEIPTKPDPDNFIILLMFVCAGLIVHVLLSFIMYRLLMLSKNQLLKVTPVQLATILGKMFLYSVVLMCLLFIAMLALLLFLGLITVIINETFGQQLLSDATLEPIVNIAMMVISLLIIMRLQPTFISLATEMPLIPMKSSFYYTRDNNKGLIAIGLFGFIPSMLPAVVVFWIINLLNLSFVSGDILALLIFPVLLIPNLVILSTGVEVYKSLVMSQQNNNLDVGD